MRASGRHSVWFHFLFPWICAISSFIIRSTYSCFSPFTYKVIISEYYSKNVSKALNSSVSHLHRISCINSVRVVNHKLYRRGKSLSVHDRKGNHMCSAATDALKLCISSLHRLFFFCLSQEGLATHQASELRMHAAQRGNEHAHQQQDFWLFWGRQETLISS